MLRFWKYGVVVVASWLKAIEFETGAGGGD